VFQETVWRCAVNLYRQLEEKLISRTILPAFAQILPIRPNKTPLICTGLKYRIKLMRSMKNYLLLLLASVALTNCVEDSFMKNADAYEPPKNLKYMEITNAREGKRIISSPPAVSTGGLIPNFEITGGYDANGNPLDDSYMQHVSITNPTTSEWKLNDTWFISENGDTIKSGVDYNYANAGVITIANGNNFTVGDYCFTIKVTTENNGVTYSTIFDKAFHLNVSPLLPSLLLYQPKTQNLVYGDAGSRTSAPLIPAGNGNRDVRFELASDAGKLQISPETGIVSLSSSYIYNGYDTIRPTIKATSNISQESVTFSGSLVVIVTDVPQTMPLESIYFFYPTLATTGALPTGGEGFSVQTIVPGSGARRWGTVNNSAGKGFVAPPERPEANKKALPIEIETNSAATVTTPLNVWLVMDTRDLSMYNLGYGISMRYYYMPAFQNYMSD
jgi:hypothetical protein